MDVTPAFSLKGVPLKKAVPLPLVAEARDAVVAALTA
jgi:hypothetical protein